MSSFQTRPSLCQHFTRHAAPAVCCGWSDALSDLRCERSSSFLFYRQASCERSALAAPLLPGSLSAPYDSLCPCSHQSKIAKCSDRTGNKAEWRQCTWLDCQSGVKHLCSSLKSLLFSCARFMLAGEWQGSNRSRPVCHAEWPHTAKPFCDWKR